MVAYAYAKINWTLDVLSRRPDGYHELDMLMQSVSVFDTVIVEPAQPLRFTCSRQDLVSKDNLVFRAAQALQQFAGIRPGASIELVKAIPIAAGMGGGSADAAAALLALSRLWQIELTETHLRDLALYLGADVPFCLFGGTMRVQGIGERLERVPLGQTMWLVVLQPCEGLSTRDVFESLEVSRIEKRPDNHAAALALADGDVHALAVAMGNVLEPVAMRLRPQIAQGIRDLQQAGALVAQLSGSGPVVFGLFENQHLAQRAYAQLRAKWEMCRLLSTYPRGVELDG